ncbi:unnamed protein product [Cyprideis torosa]|uniref:Uncharacterized protein n=1 Tax=Cyprideis torosa TaxID=163714 RepID=A0A7R8W192_9CRUS|nr:unnamed protein product [Cyprideis torosa]CAG0880652.1 unnamed protein product [Cyprideis torosa]
MAPSSPELRTVDCLWWMGGGREDTLFGITLYSSSSGRPGLTAGLLRQPSSRGRVCQVPVWLCCCSIRNGDTQVKMVTVDLTRGARRTASDFVKRDATAAHPRHPAQTVIDLQARSVECSPERCHQQSGIPVLRVLPRKRPSTSGGSRTNAQRSVASTPDSQLRHGHRPSTLPKRVSDSSDLSLSKRNRQLQVESKSSEKMASTIMDNNSVAKVKKRQSVLPVVIDARSKSLRTSKDDVSRVSLASKSSVAVVSRVIGKVSSRSPPPGGRHTARRASEERHRSCSVTGERLPMTKSANKTETVKEVWEESALLQKKVREESAMLQKEVREESALLQKEVREESAFCLAPKRSSGGICLAPKRSSGGICLAPKRSSGGICFLPCSKKKFGRNLLSALLQKEVQEESALLQKEVQEESALLQKEVQEESALLLQKEVRKESALLQKEVREESALLLQKEAHEVGSGAAIKLDTYGALIRHRVGKGKEVRCGVEPPIFL